MAYSQTTYRRETNVRTIKIRGVAVPVSDQRGGLIIFGKPEYKGRQVAIEGRDGEVKYGEKATQSFRELTINGKRQSVAVFPRLVPGTYSTDTSIGYHGYERVTITPGYVVQLDWT
jgi:hypothetical protein